MLSLKNRRLLQLGFSLALLFTIKGLKAQTEVSLNAVSWKYTKQDGSNFAFRDMNDEAWKIFSGKNSLYAADTDLLWLRGKIFIGTTNKRSALLLEKVCGRHQVYLNGKLLPEAGFTEKSYSHCPRHALHPIPLSFLNTEMGENTVAIRLIKSSHIPYLSLRGKMAILPLEAAELYLWRNYLWGLIFGFFSLVLSLFFLATYLRLYRTQEYRAFSIFLFVYAIYKFTQNEMLYGIIGFASVHERFAQFCFIILPALFYLFYISFFSIKNFRFSLRSFRIDKDAERLGNSYLFLSTILATATAISPSLSKHFKINLIWIILQTPIFIYYLFTATQNIRISLRESSSFLIGAALMCFVFLYNFLTSSENPLWDPKGGGDIFLLELSISIGLLYIIIQRKVEVEKHNKYLKSIDELQHRIFGYIGSILAKPVEQVLNFIKELGGKKNKQALSENASHIRNGIKEIQSNLDGLMELARLEVLNEPEHVEEINLYDFAQMVFANARLNSHIRVDPETTIETGLDLMNSSMLYLVDFLNQQEFSNIDLIVTTQTGNNILFHFLAFHSERSKIREVHSICSHVMPLRDPRWIKWSIISEIIRVMKGKISLSKIHGRFLRINISLPRSLRPKEVMSDWEKIKDKQKGISIVYDIAQNNTQENKTEEKTQEGLVQSEEKQGKTLTENYSPSSSHVFHSQMSISEFLTLLKFKLARRGKT